MESEKRTTGRIGWSSKLIRNDIRQIHIIKTPKNMLNELLSTIPL